MTDGNHTEQSTNAIILYLVRDKNLSGDLKWLAIPGALHRAQSTKKLQTAPPAGVIDAQTHFSTVPAEGDQGAARLHIIRQ